MDDKYWFLTVLSVVMALMLAFALPSGAITDEARLRYESPAYETDDEEEYDFYEEWPDEEDCEENYNEARLTPRLVLAAAPVLSDVTPSEDYTLPVEHFTPGAAPLSENFTPDGYDDPTISVRMDCQRMYDSDVYLAYIRVASPTQLRTAIAGTKMSKEKTAGTSSIAKAYNAIVAVNGDYYLKFQAGYITRMGESYREKPSKQLDMLLIDENGDFHLCKKGKTEQTAFVEAFRKEHTIVNGFLFGPALIMDGVVQETKDYGLFAPTANNPRAAIGQLDTLTYVIAVVNGRTSDSEGCTLSEMADIMSYIGCKQAYNLDGGNSATLVFNGNIYNTKPQAERGILDIIYFASAYTDEN